jgi:hypothetical protein
MYIESIHLAVDKMDQLLGYWSDSHTLHTKLLCLDAPSVMMPRVTFDSHRNGHDQVLRLNPDENPPSIAWGGFEAQPPKLSWVSQHVRIPHVLDMCLASPRPH